MKTQLRLNSVVLHGVGSGSESLAIDFIYMNLLHEFGQDVYRYISINQIGDDLDEFVMKESNNNIHVNIRYPAYYDFEAKNVHEKNRIRLDVIHSALLRIVEYEKKLNIQKLEMIKSKILENDFCFEFVIKEIINKKNPILLAKILINPLMDRSIYSVTIEQNTTVKCRQVIFTGIPGYSYANLFFHYGRWKNDNEFIIFGKKKTVETKIKVDKCIIEIVNLTSYSNPPYYTLMRHDATNQEKKNAKEDWEHSLNPAIAAIIRQAHN